VRDFDATEEADEGADVGGGGVALHHDDGWVALLEDGVNGSHELAVQLRQTLAGLKDGEAEVWAQVQTLHELIDKVRVLPRQADHSTHASVSKRSDDGGEFDRLWPRPNQDEGRPHSQKYRRGGR
jgi:hypothetical protein